MKKTFILAITLVMSVTAFAQQLATLNHNDSITVYYGMNALQQAHASAVNGDIITLSPGIFNSVNITKAVTIRGAGAWADTNGNNNTILYNDFTLNVPNDPLYYLTIEGVYSMNSIGMTSVYNPQFKKCHFVCFGNQNSGTMQNATFINCILETWRNSQVPAGSTWSAQGTQFVNCVILSTSNAIGATVTYTSDPASFVNCILCQHQTPTFSDMTVRLFQNCILFDNYAYSALPSNDNNGSTAFNCMFINTSNTIYLFRDTPNHVLWNKSGMSTIFKNFTGTYNSTTTFELQDSIAANYLGLDGTQIGIYGGLHPFSPKVTNPAIKRINVAQRNNSEGKLEVNVEMVTEEE